MPDYASCCLLSYQRPRFLETAISTLVSHAGAPLELIVHDDGSWGEARREIEAFLAGMLEDGLVSTVIFNPPGHNQGVGDAINRMFSMASGDPLIKLDQDLVFKPGWLAQVNDVLSSAPLPPLGAAIELRSAKGERQGITLVDEEDYETLAQWRWSLHPKGYASRWGNGRTLLMHRELAEADAREVDHRNGRRLDNRRSNLRVATRGENAENLRAGRGSSRYRGVSWNEREQRWYGFVKHHREQHFVGSFEDEVAAAEACEVWRQEHMPFAQPDPHLVPDPPPIGMLALMRYLHEPVDHRKTVMEDFGRWSQHTHILGSGFAMPRAAWDAHGPFDSHSEAFAEDWTMMQRLTASGLYACALPDEDLVTNQGFGVGPSTVVPAHGKVAEIHKEPRVIGRG